MQANNVADAGVHVNVQVVGRQDTRVRLSFYS